MKKLFYILIFVFPVVSIAQQPWYKYSPTDYTWKYVGQDNFSAEEAVYLSFAFSPTDGQPYVAFADRAVYYKATVMKFDGTSWTYVGSEGFSVTVADYTSLAFSPSGEPYVAYSDDSDTGRTTVMKFDGNNWVNAGNADFSKLSASFNSLAFSPIDGQPYLAFQDKRRFSDGIYYKATVMKLVGTNWVDVGAEGFSAGQADYTNLAFSPSGDPYVAFEDYGNSNKVTVMKFDGINWENVGPAGFSAGKAEYTSLAFSPSGDPYVAFEDQADSANKATVMKFDGTNWVNVGNEGFSAGWVMFTSLAFSPSGQPFVAYMDFEKNGAATVMKFDGVNWVNVGDAGFSLWWAESESLAFSSSGQLFVAYANGNLGQATVMKYDSLFVGFYDLQKSKFSLYPNPATDKITIETKGNVKAQLSIMNNEDKELITCQITQPKHK